MRNRSRESNPQFPTAGKRLKLRAKVNLTLKAASAQADAGQDRAGASLD